MLVPHGGVLGLDGVFDGRAIIRDVTGSYTPESAASTVARVLGGVHDIVPA